MIEEILSAVRDAETQANAIKADAENRADAVRAEADREQAETVEKAKLNAKEYKSAQIAAAEKRSAEQAAEKAAETRLECENLKKNYAMATDELAKEIFRRIVDGNF